MDRIATDEMLGPYRLLRPLEPTALAQRWVALHEQAQTTWVLHTFDVCRTRAEARRFVHAMERLAALHAPHILRVEQYALTRGGRPWAATDYLGSQVGLVTLESLRMEKGGVMAVSEIDNVVRQILSACAAAHDADLRNGAFQPDQLVVDRSGSVWIDMYAVARMMHAHIDPDAEIVRDELRSVVELGYTLLTGLPAEEPRISVARLVKRHGPAWEAWIEEGLSAVGGYESASQAMDALPGARTDTPDQHPLTVRTMLGRVRAALGTR